MPSPDRRLQYLIAGTVALLVALIVGLVTFALVQQRQALVQRVEQTAQDLVRVTEEHARGSIDAVDVTLSSVARALQILPGRGNARDPEIHALLRANLTNLPHVRAIWILDADGQMIHDSDNLPGQYNLSERAYFRVHRDSAELGMYLDPPILSRLGVWTLAASRRINRGDGSFAGIVAAAIEPQYFEQFYGSLSVGSGGSLSVLRLDGTLIVRSPAAAARQGKVSMPPPPFVALLDREPVGTYRMRSAVDGIERVYAYRRVAGRPLVLLVGLDEAEHLADWRHAAIATGAAALAFTGLLAWLGWLVLRELARRSALNQALSDSAQRLQLAASAGRIGLWDWDLGTQRVHYSAEWKRQLGCADDDVGDSFEEWRSRIHPDDLDRALRTLGDYQQQHGPDYRSELRLRHRSGSYRHILSRATLVLDDHGQALRMMGTHVDVTERKAAESALRDSEARFRATFEQAAVGVALVGLDGRWLRINQRLCDIVGYSAAELELLRYQDITHADDLGADLGLVQRLLAGEMNTYSLEKRYLRKSGEAVWIQLVVSLVRGDDGAPSYFISVVSDIDDRRRAEAALAQARSRLQGILDSAMDAIVSIDDEQRIVLFNPAAERMFGWTAAQLQGQSIDRLLPLAARDRHAEHIRHFAADGKTSRPMGVKGALGALSGLRADGSEFPIEASISQLTQEGRRFLTVILRDTTERMRADAALRDAAARYRQLFEANPHPMWIRDAKSLACLLVNDSALRHFGYSRDEFMVLSVEDLLAPGLAPRLRAALAATSLHGNPPQLWQLRVKSGAIIEAEVSWQALDIDGRPAWVAMAHDVTEQRRATQQVLDSREALRALLQRLQFAQEEERTRIAREVHDELGQQLTGLKMDLRWIERRLSDSGLPVPLVPVLDRVVAASALTDMTIATVQRLASELRPGVLDQLGLPAALAQRARQLQQRTGIACDFVCDDAVPDLAPALANELYYICQEALTNVTRHAQAQQVIVRLRLSPRGDAVLMEVEDDGVGTDLAAQFRADSLGLLGMRERALQCGGSVRLEAVVPQGLRVIVEVPLAASEPHSKNGP
ncbi:MAG: PAS domain S-box protein [Rubrivivax sp.]|nr:PAS domain S-box protein [Rubrivivax sp.]